SPLDEAKRAGLQALDVLQEVAVAEEKGANGRAGPPKKPRSALGHRAIISDRAVRTGAERVDRGRRGPIIGECGALSSLPSCAQGAARWPRSPFPAGLRCRWSSTACRTR